MGYIEDLAHDWEKSIEEPQKWRPDDILKFLRVRYGDYIKLELGPGRHYGSDGEFAKKAWATVGLNASADPYSDIFYNLERGIPLPDECIDEIYCNQLLEHINCLIYLMNECWRVLKPGGFMEACVPHWQSVYAWGDPTHVRAFTEASFQYFCIEHKTKRPFVESFSDYGIECGFILEKHNVRRRVDITVVLRKPEEGHESG